mgnify:CR=1 FL=1
MVVKYTPPEAEELSFWMTDFAGPRLTGSAGGDRGNEIAKKKMEEYGFKNVNRVEYKGINISVLQDLAEKNKLEKIDIQTLISAGFISKNALVKILGKGTLEKKLEVHAHAFSKSAVAAIEAKNGTAVKL